MKSMILAAGRGTRLRPLSYFWAKPAVSFVGRPLIHYSLESLRQTGIHEFVINLHHLPESVTESVRGEEGTFHFSEEMDEILGTAGGIRHARKWLEGSPFVLINGKIYFEQPLREIIEFHQKQEALATLALVPYSPKTPFNPVFVSTAQDVVGFGGGFQLQETDKAQKFIFTGVHVLSPEVLDFIPPGRSDIVDDIYPRLMRQGSRIKAFISEAFWCECSTPVRYFQNSLKVAARLNAFMPEAGSTRSLAGKECELGQRLSANECIFWDKVKVGSNCRLKRVIATEKATIPQGSVLEDLIITRPPPENEIIGRYGGRLENNQVYWDLF